MTTLELRFLGGLSIQQAGQPLTDFKSQKGQALLCYLALTGKAHARPALAGLFWPEKPDDNALMNLRVTLKKLNVYLEPHLTATRQSIAFNQEADYWLDVAAFAASLAAKGDIGRLRAAIALYQGDFLEGFYLDDAPEFETWVLGQRAHLRQAALDVLQHLVAHFSNQGVYETAVAYARQLLAIEPWQEEGHRELMRLLALSGQRSAALAQYGACQRILAEELGVEPGPATVELYGQIKEHGVTETRSLTLPHTSDKALPALPHPHNLPIQAPRFIGRKAEVAVVRQQLAQPTTRLLTLTGTGGTGKTRLSLQVAAESLPHFADGVYFVPLATITDPTLVAATIGRQLGLQESPGMQPWSEVLAAYLRDKQMLLVLDNFEQIVTAAPQLAEWLTTAPQLKLLVTSRVLLRLSHEQSYEVLPLLRPNLQQLPPLAQLGQVEAVQLFIERAQTAKATFSLTLDNSPDVAEICARLDGLPLAIELAAARIRLMSPRQMRERLNQRLQWLTGGARDAPARQQTLRATLDWSHDLLPTAEQTLFRRLAVFVGGCTLEAAEAMANAESNLDVLNGLENLLDHHLLQQQEVAGEPRFTMLETIREYALEKLAESGETEAMQQQHAAYFVALAEIAQQELNGPEQLSWFNRLEVEHDNLRAVLERAAKEQLQEVGVGLRLAIALGLFWGIRHRLEGIKWVDRLLDQGRIPYWPVRTGFSLPPVTLLEAIELDRAFSSYQQSLTLCRLIDHKQGAAWALLGLGTVAIKHRENLRATEFLEQSLAISREINDDLGIGETLYRLGQVAILQAKYEQAAVFLEEALALYQKTGNKQGVTNVLIALSWVAISQKNYGQIMTFLAKAFTIGRELGDKQFLAQLMSDIEYQLRDLLRYIDRDLRYRSWDHPLHPEIHEQLFVMQELLALAREKGNQDSVKSWLKIIGFTALYQGDFMQAKVFLKEALLLENKYRAESTSNPLRRIGICLFGLARLAVEENEAERAACLFSFIGREGPHIEDNLRSLRFQYRLSDKSGRFSFNGENAVRAQLDKATFDRAWAAGQAMSLEEAVTYALEEVNG